MRSLLVLIDGLGDEPIATFGGLTPFEKAIHPHIDSLAAAGTLSAVSICENDITPESCSCILRLLGVDKKNMPHNRAYMELLAQGRDISEYEMVLRCNLVAVDDADRLAAFNGQGLSASEMEQAAAVCDAILKDVEFIHLSEYRNLLILNREQEILDCAVQPPHESIGENAEKMLADLCGKSLALNYFLQEAEKRLASFNKNGLRYMLYPWGASAREELPSFYDLHKIHGGAVCKAEIVRGIAKALEIDICVPQGATGDVDTNVAAKAAATIKMLQNNDFVIAHFNGSDEAAHRYDAAGKAAFIEKIDREFIASVLEHLKGPLKIVICGDHVTSSVTGRHGKGKVPVVAAAVNTGMRNIAIDSYRDILKFLMREE